MAFDVSALSAYVANNSKEIAVASVSKAKTAALLIANGAVQFGVKGTEALLVMSNSVNLQDASTCSRTALGDVVLSNRTITVKPIADNQNLCPKVLWNTFYAANLQKGQSPQEDFTPEFARQIMDSRAELIAFENEKLIWQGDTSLTGTTNMKRIDGFIKQIGTGYTITATGTTIVEKLQSAFLTSNIADRTAEDFRIFIGEDKAAEYTVALASKNYFKPTDEITIFGTTGKLEVVSGLNGTGKIYAGNIKNLRLGMDGESDADSAELRYSIETKNWYMDFQYALGVGVYLPNRIGVATV